MWRVTTHKKSQKVSEFDVEWNYRYWVSSSSIIGYNRDCLGKLNRRWDIPRHSGCQGAPAHATLLSFATGLMHKGQMPNAALLGLERLKTLDRIDLLPFVWGEERCTVGLWATGSLTEVWMCGCKSKKLKLVYDDHHEDNNIANQTMNWRGLHGLTNSVSLMTNLFQRKYRTSTTWSLPKILVR